MDNQKNANPNSSIFSVSEDNFIVILGGIVSIIGVVLFIWSLFNNKLNDYSSSSSCAMFIGISIIYNGFRFRKRDLRLKQYVDLIHDKHITSISEVTKCVNVPIETVIEDLEIMVQKGVLGDVVINRQKKEIITVDAANKQTQFDNDKNIVICKNCGASNIITLGENNICEYCGSKLN